MRNKTGKSKELSVCSMLVPASFVILQIYDCCLKTILRLDEICLDPDIVQSVDSSGQSRPPRQIVTVRQVAVGTCSATPALDRKARRTFDIPRFT